MFNMIITINYILSELKKFFWNHLKNIQQLKFDCLWFVDDVPHSQNPQLTDAMQ
jgi:hypothetical protein